MRDDVEREEKGGDEAGDAEEGGLGRTEQGTFDHPEEEMSGGGEKDEQRLGDRSLIVLAAEQLEKGEGGLDRQRGKG